ncbi:hypothetical protein FACS1894170_00930 [Planctomycetales bacterium]|nr:hypothetical protein FACS1894170_00930 [Planctomycetales bacterium]
MTDGWIRQSSTRTLGGAKNAPCFSVKRAFEIIERNNSNDADKPVFPNFRGDHYKENRYEQVVHNDVES